MSQKSTDFYSETTAQQTMVHECLKNSNTNNNTKRRLGHGPGYGSPYVKLLFDLRYLLDHQALFFNLLSFAVFIKLLTGIDSCRSEKTKDKTKNPVSLFSRNTTTSRGNSEKIRARDGKLGGHRVGHEQEHGLAQVVYTLVSYQQ